MSPDAGTSATVAEGSSQLVLQYEVEQFLYHEADLLDGGRFEQWLELMAPDVRYWAPVRANRLYRERNKETSPSGESAYFDEGRDELVQRVQRLRTRMAWAEDPPSRTRHLIANVHVSPTAIEGEYEAASNFYVYRTRLERDTDQWVGKREDVIRQVDGPQRYQIARRTIVFDVAILLAKNLSVFF
jgi:3-phenylpropionate/cinnamic acid dioxygenase small subunit